MRAAEPLVSVCIPTYNYRRYLAAALDSALVQSFTDIEIVVVDNCSDDGTPELMDEYCRRDGRIRFHRNDSNIGMTANFNRAMELARGRYVKFLCADDVLTRDSVGRLFQAMEQNPQVSLAAGARFLFGPGEPRQADVTAVAAPPAITEGTQTIRECFFRGNFIGEPTAVMFRRKDAGSGFDGSYRQAIDVDLWFRLLETGRLAYFRDPVCGIRLHESTGTAGNLRSGRITDDKVRLFQRYARKPYLRGHALDKLLWDARMASSLAKQAAAGSSAGESAAIEATYHPALTRTVLRPLAGILARLRTAR